MPNKQIFILSLNTLLLSKLGFYTGVFSNFCSKTEIVGTHYVVNKILKIFINFFFKLLHIAWPCLHNDFTSLSSGILIKNGQINSLV